MGGWGMGGQGDKGTRGQGDKGTRGQGDKGSYFILTFLTSAPLPLCPSAPLPLSVPQKCIESISLGH
jgi:hypothetical protein